MSQGSDPSTDNKGVNAFNTVNSTKTTSVVNLGAVFTNEAKPRRIDIRYEGTTHTLSCMAESGSNPTIVFRKFSDFMNRGQHEGHRISRAGTVRNALGHAEVWYCQDDNTICYDNKS